VSFGTACCRFSQCSRWTCLLQAIALHGPKIEVMDSKAAAYEKLGDLGTALQVGRQCVKMFPASTKVSLTCTDL
jgi:hypothetical protein